MNIGMLLDNDYSNDLRVENEAMALSSAGHKVYIFCFNYNNLPENEIRNGITVIRFKISKNIKNKMKGLTNTFLDFSVFYWKRKLLKAIEKYHIEALHIHDLPHLKVGYYLKTKNKIQIPLISDLHENYTEALRNYKFANKFPGKLLISFKKWDYAEIKWLKKADFIITVIEEAVERYKNLGLEDKEFEVVANYVNPEEFLKNLNTEKMSKNNKLKIIYVGGFDIHRGLESVIKSIPKLKESIDNFEINLVGDGANLVDLKSLANELNVNEFVNFLGWQPAHQLSNFIESSDICLIPHLKTKHTDNTIPHKLFQYMLLEKPVISSNCKPLNRIVQECDCGLIYKSNDSIDLAGKIIILSKDEALREVMGINGKKAVLDKYNWMNTSKSLINLYNKIEKQRYYENN